MLARTSSAAYMGLLDWLRRGSGGPEAPVSFDTTAWKEVVLDDGRIGFVRDQGDHLIAYSFELEPDIPVPLESLDELRSFYRSQIQETGGALVSLDVVTCDEVDVIVLLFKTPQGPSGMTYAGSITIPFRDRSWVINVQCPEFGITGMRDTAVFAKLSDTEADGWEERWSRDPYAPGVRANLMRNLADDEQYDADFPDHPASRARRYLSELQSSLRFSPAQKSAPRFMG